MNGRAIVSDGAPAFDLRGLDEPSNVYLQTQVLAGTHQPEQFWTIVDGIRRHFAMRPPPGPVTGRFVELEDADVALPDEVRARADGLFDSFGYAPAEKAWGQSYFGWKMSLLPPGLKNILSVGCGGGAELIFLRLLYPEARITALDYRQYVHGGGAQIEALDVDFREGDIFQNLSQTPGDFDLVFSNHVIEHFFEPDHQISMLTSVLARGGLFVAGLPLDASLYSEELQAMARRPDAIHPIDIGWMDPRHPWKTNEADLASTLVGAGLSEVTINQRARHVSMYKPIELAEVKARERVGRRIYALTLAPLSAVLKLVFGPRPPRVVARLFFALDRRLWFGRYCLKSEFQPEVLVVAVKA